MKGPIYEMLAITVAVSSLVFIVDRSFQHTNTRRIRETRYSCVYSPIVCSTTQTWMYGISAIDCRPSTSTYMTFDETEGCRKGVNSSLILIGFEIIK